MKITIKENTEQIIRNQYSVSIIAKPNTHSKIILFEPQKLSINLKPNSYISIFIFHKNSRVKKQFTLEKNSKLESYDFIINSTIECLTKLEGKNASFINKNLSLSTTESTINTEIIHNSKETKSSILNKCLIGKNSITKCKGKILIPKTSINCESHQKSESILLDETSKCEASPILEIFNDQVSCSHSATISYINQEKLFYLNSRGLNEKKATNLILEAFLQTILQEIPEPIANKAKEEIQEVLK